MMAALGYKTAKALDPLLQLVGGPVAKYKQLEKIVRKAGELRLGSINSDAPFRCLAGKLSTTDQINLLKAIAEGKMNLKTMQAEAEQLKMLAHIKEVTATELGEASFEDALHKYGEKLLGDNILSSFINHFLKCLRTKKKTTPPTFKWYMETV